MPGWNLKNGELQKCQISEDEYWSLFNFVFSDACMKRNTYKFGLIKSIMDNLFNCTQDDYGNYRLSYSAIFEKFTINYWNLVLKYHLKQMRSDGRTEVSKIESILLAASEENDLIKTLDFNSLSNSDRSKVVRQVSIACRKNVIGALYNDMEGKLYGFDLKEKEIMLVQMQGDPKNANKPKEILEKIVAGKLGKYYSENCLMEQVFVKDDSQKVSQVIGNKFKVTRFVRFEMGAGIEKKSENLQDEVQKQIDAMKK